MPSGLLKNTIAKMMALTAIAAMAILPAVHVAFAGSTAASLPPEYAEILLLAQERVQASTQPDAFGNGTPILTDMTGMLPWIGIAISAALETVVAARILTSKMQNEALLVQ